MFIGFDYGTSNCAVAVMEQGSPRLLNLGASRYLPSTLHAPHRDAIAGLLAEGLAPAQQAEYLKLRGPVVTRAQMVRRQMREEGLIDELCFGGGPSSARGLNEDSCCQHPKIAAHCTGENP